MSKFFITRPIFAMVISIIIVLAGLASAFTLPIAQYPEIAPPTVIVTASYPGASADTLIKTVAGPIEEQLNGTEGLLYFNSIADSAGNLSIVATFEVGTDINQATFNVSNRVNTALPRLPDDVRRNGLIVQKRSNDILLVATVSSTDGKYDPVFLSNYSTINVLDDIKRIKGVGDAGIFGAQDYSMRVWLKPDRMAQLGVTTSDISAAIQAQNAQYAAGKIGQNPAPKNQSLVFTVTAKGRMVDPEQFGNIILRASGPSGTLYLKDVARIELGAQSYDMVTTLDGKPTVGIRVFLQSGANALDTAKAIKTKLAEIEPSLPPGVKFGIPYDTSDFVRASIMEVGKTLLEAISLVTIVVFVFLQSWRATLIPVIAVPVSLIGTFGGLLLFGFSINTLTLFAMVLAIGIVVDDAIVVLENVERLMNVEKLPPKEAAIKAMKEVSSAVVAIVLVLCAVFIPVAFLGGIAGRLYQQFAVTVAVSVVISGVVALTLTPALCAMLLKPNHKESALFKPFNRGFAWLTNTYAGGVTQIMRHKFLGALTFIGILVLAAWLVKHVPGSFVPSEDQGYVISAVTLPDAATLGRTSKSLETVRSQIAKDSAVAHEFAVSGFDLISSANKTNSATMFVRLTDWDARETTATDIVKKLTGIGMQLSDGLGIGINPPPIRGLGSSGGFEVYVQSKQDTNPLHLSKVVSDFVDALKTRQELVGINTFFKPKIPQLFVDVDEPKAISLGVPIASIYATLQSTMGSLYVNDFNKNGRTYRVQLQAEPQYRMKPEDLGKVYVRSDAGAMIPMSAVSTVHSIVGAEQLERYNGLISAKVIGSGKPEVSSGDAIKIVEEVAKQTIPEGYAIAWTGQAYQEKRTGSAAVFAFGFAIVMVFLILAAQFETWSLPLAVIMAVPFALCGALIAVMFRGMPNDIYFQIGLVTLVGLAAKNAILIVEFATQKHEEGMSLFDSAVAAARLRFRPIMMTSIAFILGIAPLVFASGAGAAARRSMGTGVFGGMLVATFIATAFVPLFFLWMTNKKAPPRQGHAHAPALEHEEMAP